MNKKVIQEFKDIYKKEFKKELCDVVARHKAERLLNLFKVIYKPTQKNESRK